MLSSIENEVELLERHIKILNQVIEHEPIGIIKLSEITRMPQHKIRYSLRILENGGLIKPSQRGALSTEKGKNFLSELSSRLDQIIEKIKAFNS